MQTAPMLHPNAEYILLLQIAGTYFAYLMNNANPGTCSLHGC